MARKTPEQINTDRWLALKNKADATLERKLTKIKQAVDVLVAAEIAARDEHRDAMKDAERRARAAQWDAERKAV